MSDDNFLSRWSRRKTASKAGLAEPTADTVPAQAGIPSPPAAEREAGETTSNPEPLPPVESLTPESDFAPFMKPEVDASTRRAAVKKLFEDPRFNVMDGLDVYIDDYSKPDPLPEGWLEKMTQVARLGIFREPTVEAAEPVEAVSPALQNPIPEPPPQPSAEASPPDISESQSHPPK